MALMVSFQSDVASFELALLVSRLKVNDSQLKTQNLELYALCSLPPAESESHHSRLQQIVEMDHAFGLFSWIGNDEAGNGIFFHNGNSFCC